MSDNKKENLFAKLAQQSARSEQEEPAAVQPPVDTPPSPALPVAKPKTAPSKQRGEPTTGRRANPDYCQANAYVLKTVRRSVDRALLDMEGMDYSTLVEELLVKWLKSRRVSD